MKKWIKKRQNKTKGMPSAVLLSILIHGGLFLLAGMLVVFTVVKKEEQKFEPPKLIERPKMKLKKPKVKVKKTSKPKPTTRIVTKINRANMPEIQLPEMSGLSTGLASGLGGFDLMPSFDEVSIFGGEQSIGNDFRGALYDLKRNRQGKGMSMGSDQFRLVIRKFVRNGWDASVLAKYYVSPSSLFTTHFMIPLIPAPLFVDAFGSPETEAYFFFLKYKGDLVYTEDIKFRFWGMGDSYMMVRVDGKDVLVAGWDAHDSVFDWWKSSSADNRKYFLANQAMTVGDWIALKAGKPVEMEILFGEWNGGSSAAILLVEVDGVEYPKNKQGGPILPAFRTEEFSLDLREQIQGGFPKNEASLTTGPVFRDYKLPSEGVVNHADALELEPDSPKVPVDASIKGKLRAWILSDGRSVEASFEAIIGGNVLLKNAKGKSVKIPQDLISGEDLKLIQLSTPPTLGISFSKTSKQRSYPETISDQIPSSFYFDFSATIKQTSTGSYDQELTAELFVIGAEVDGNNHTLLAYEKNKFFLTEDNQRRYSLRCKTVEVTNYLVGTWWSGGIVQRGERYATFLVVISDANGNIISHKTPRKWLFEHLENLRKIPIGKHMDKTCTRVAPTPPKALLY